MTLRARTGANCTHGRVDPLRPFREVLKGSPGPCEASDDYPLTGRPLGAERRDRRRHRPGRRASQGREGQRRAGAVLGVAHGDPRGQRGELDTAWPRHHAFCRAVRVRSSISVHRSPPASYRSSMLVTPWTSTSCCAVSIRASLLTGHSSSGAVLQRVPGCSRSSRNRRPRTRRHTAEPVRIPTRPPSPPVIESERMATRESRGWDSPSGSRLTHRRHRRTGRARGRG